jgi:DNA-binding GntR family transcriptional regulator
MGAAVSKELDADGNSVGELAGLPGFQLGQAQTTSIASAVVPVLREAIISGRLAAGTRLSEVQLARHFNTSRTPVREALEQLDREQLVEVVPYVGSRVRPITQRDVEEIYQVRVALETFAVSLILQRLTAVGRARIGEALNVLKLSIEGADPDRFAAARDDFHLLLIELSGNSLLERLYRGLIGPIRRLRRIVQAQDQTLMQRNIKIAEGILALDPSTPEIIRSHLMEATHEVIFALNDTKEENKG